MKCKKCFKIIPPGEEIIHNPCGGRYSDSSGGGYCEPCYKKCIASGESWFWVLFIVLLVIVVLFGIFIIWWVKKKDNKENDED